MEEVCGGVYVLINETTNVSWDVTLAMFARSDFTTQLFQFELTKLNNKTVEHVTKVVNNYTIDQATKAFGPLACMYTWLKNMARYYEVYKIVAPKQRNVKIMEEKHQQGLKEQEKTKKEIAKLDAELKTLTSELDKQQKEQSELAEKMTKMKI